MTSRKNSQPQSPVNSKTAQGGKPSGPVLNADGVPLARVRRAPRPLPFLLTGIVLGLIAGFVLSIRTEDGSYDPASASSYVMLFLALIGALLGGVAFVLADRRS